MKWFKHDSDAHRDAKLKRVKMKYGMEGYGLYWYCLELIAGDVDQHNLTFKLEHDAEIIADDTGISSELVQEMMSFMCNLKLFEVNRGIITCLKLAQRLDQSMTSNIEMRKVIKEIRTNHDSIMTSSEQNRIEEKRVEKKEGRFAPPSLKDVAEYCLERGNNIDPQAFHDFYTSKGWMVGKNKMKDWKACVRTWEKKETRNSANLSDTFGGAL